jgi:hypothetical protein
MGADAQYGAPMDEGVRQVFESTRHFQVWRYTVSRSQLLLRSTIGPMDPMRVHVLFKGVDSLHLPRSFDGLRVQQTDDRKYRLSGSGWFGEVEALVCFVEEDDGEYDDPGPFQASFP